MIPLSTRCTAVGTLVRGTRGRQKSTADRTADSTANSTADETRWSFKKKSNRYFPSWHVGKRIHPVTSVGQP